MATLSGNVGPYMVPLGRPQRRVWPGAGLVDVGALTPKRKGKGKRDAVRGGGEMQIYWRYTGEGAQGRGILLIEEAANVVDFDGYWVTADGRRVFIGAKALLMKPKKPANFKMKRVKKTKKDGTVYYEEREPDAWVERKVKYKFARTASMARNFDNMGKTLEREATDTDDLTPDKVVATALLLVHATGMRIGGAHGGPGKSKRRRVKGGEKPSDELVETFGATTLQRRHVRVDGDTVHLKYIGKSGVEHDKSVRNKALATSVKQLLGGKTSGGDDTAPLFQYSEGGARKTITRAQCGGRLKKFNDHYTPKDMRTVRANIVASDVINNAREKYVALRKKKLTDKERAAAAKELVDEIGGRVASVLGNTKDVAIGSYVNPALVEYAVKEAGLA
jgi:DNA topoisomerase IB